MAKKKKSKKAVAAVEVWTQEEYEEYLKALYDMEFIAGFTEGGMPYGIFRNVDGEKDKPQDNPNHDDNLPF